MRTKVSVIIPAYNVVDHLPKCLDSLLNQNLRDIDIIVVNDASSDDSQLVIERYCAKDRRIRSITNSGNMGPFLSRLRALHYVTGQYVTFVDSDDSVEPGAYEAMYNKAVEGNFDIVACSIRRLEDGVVDKNYLNNTIVNEGIYGQDILKNLLLEKVSNSLWNKLYRRETVDTVLNDDLFVEMRRNLESNGISLLIEDQLFNIFASFYSKSYFMTGESYYNYNFRDSSLCAVKSIERQHEWSKSAMHNFYILEKFLKREGVYNDFRDEIEEMKIRLVVKRKRRVLSFFNSDIIHDSDKFEKTVDQLTQYVSKEYLLKHVVDAAILEISQLKKEKKKLLRQKSRLEAEQGRGNVSEEVSNILSLPWRVVTKVKRKILRKLKN